MRRSRLFLPSIPSRGGRSAPLLVLILFALVFALPAAAAPLGRPIWWKISDGGGSTLWILGVPDGVLDTIEWKQDALEHRLELADAAVMPMLQTPDPWGKCPEAILTKPGGDMTDVCGPHAWARTMMTPPLGLIYWDDPNSRRLPPELVARVNKALPSIFGDPGSAMRHARTMDLALWLDLWNWPHGGVFDEPRLGNAITFQALRLAQARGLRTEIVPQPKLWMPVFASPYQGEVTPPEALQQACLEQVMDQTESGRMAALRMAAQQAWVDGDLDHALRRTGTVQYCLMGEEKSTGFQDYLQNAAYRYYSRLDKAFDAPGQTVALIELDPLLLADGGVLDHYRSLAYDITTSDGME